MIFRRCYFVLIFKEKAKTMIFTGEHSKKNKDKTASLKPFISHS